MVVGSDKAKLACPRAMIQTLHLFRPLNRELLDTLRTLTAADWSRKTVARAWTIKDVASHLLDGNLRAIALYRDGWQLPPPAIRSYEELVAYLNRLNASWVAAAQRLSPALLMEWLEVSHESYIQCLEALDPDAPAVYGVAWAGESVSTNAFHVAREYTEKWHHQQQIQDALGSDRILTAMYYRPVLDTFLMGLPHAYRQVNAANGARVVVEIAGDAGGIWTLERTGSGWRLFPEFRGGSAVHAVIPAYLAWKLFTKAVAPEEVRPHLTMVGNEEMAKPLLGLIAVMALR